MRNVYLRGKVCRVATGREQLSNCSFTSALPELNTLAFERMLQKELQVVECYKSAEVFSLKKNKPPHSFLSGPHVLNCCFSPGE